ncbi:MAG TPA: hypothetical protein VFQ61_31675 [Polyangiaceae bacterium]|nr:hypothetical protein [Polyangiaceae bacterium]
MANANLLRTPAGEILIAPETSRPLSAALLRDIAREFPRFRVVSKHESRLCRAIHAALIVLTLGGQRRFLDGYYTVLFDTLYVPTTAWEALDDIDRVILLRHERVHLRQRRRYGGLGMAFIYLVPIFPLGLAWGRARLEWEAYAETLRATAELRGLPAAQSATLRNKIIDRFVGPDYGWMWPFRSTIERWYRRVLEELASQPGARLGSTPASNPFQK